MKAWYFSDTDCRLSYGDGREIKAGTTHTVDCKPVLCKSGLHGSVNIRDALQYAPGPYVWRVNLRGDVVRGDDKCVATSREYLWGFNATDVLQKFARMCALDVALLWDAPEVVVQFLKTGDESLRAAAGAAARAAAWAAAWAAARTAAWAAAWAAAWDAAGAAAWAAARTAAWAAAWDAACNAACNAAGAAAGAAAWAAARAAAEDKQSNRLYRMIMEAKP